MSTDSFFSFFRNLFGNEFMPHGHCYFWRPEIVWLHVISDALITLSYYAIPVILLFFMRKRKDFPFPWVLVMFGAFILLCGTTHLMAIITLWDPLYRLDGIIKAATAVVSVLTTIMLIPLVPLALALKSPKELEAANLKLAEANEKLTEIDRLKDNFFSNISHELRTPLTLIIAPLESFLANDYGPLSAIQRQNLEAMHNNSIRLFQMVNSILDFAKIGAKKIAVNREPLDIVLLTKSIAQEFEPILKQKNIQINFDCPVTKKIVHLDRYLYERILFNLLSNAAKFTAEQGSISVALNFAGEKATLVVSDTGIGISASDQEKLFQRFQQIESSATRRFEGTGLGLALIKEFALLLEGDVKVESKLGKGTSFSVEVHAPPVGVGTETIVNPLEGRFQKFEIAPIQESKFSAVSTTERNNSKILIAEDNLELATYITSLLSGFAQAKHARDGEEAWETIKVWEPDLVILDVMMPKRDGISLCQEIKSFPKTAHTPVILLTALTHRDALMRGWEAGADEYLFKPFHPKEFLTRIKLLLAHARDNRLVQELNRKLINAARLAGMAEVAKNMLHNVGNILNSANVTTNLLLEKLLKSEIKNLDKLTEWIKVALEDPTDFMNDRKKQSDFIFYFTQLKNKLLREQEEYFNELKTLNKDIHHINEIISLQQQVDEPFGIVEEIDLVELLNDSLAVGLGENPDIQIVKNYMDNPKVILDKMRLQAILVNLIRNAKEALQESQQASKELTITTLTKEEEGKEWLEIEVSDNGLGIYPEILNEIFAFGFSTKPEGHGFGLHISALTAQEMGGNLSAKSEGKEQGATFCLKLPTAPPDTKNWVAV